MQELGDLVTFIIPAYNVENYIGECLDSLLNQTRTRHKIIVVNDGSTDKTGDIAKAYAERYPSIIRFLNQENKGQGAARNAALTFVNTPYVTYLDSDDIEECHFVERLENELSRHDESVDIVFTLPWCFDSVTNVVYEWRDRYLMESLFYPYGGREDVISHEMTKNDPRWMKMYLLEASCCRCVFNTAFLKRIGYFYPEETKWEDVWPHFCSIHYAQRCIGLKSTGFCYRVNNATQTTSANGASRLDVVSVFSDILRKAMQMKWQEQEIAYIIEMYRDFAAWSINVTNTDYINGLLRKVHDSFRSIPKRYLKNYCAICERSKKELLYIHLLRSPFYGVLADYRVRNICKLLYGKLKRIKHLVKR